MLTLLGALAFAAAPIPPRDHAPPSVGRGTDTVRVVLVVDDTVARRSLVRGARLGAEEAAHTGALFGTAVTLRVETPASLDAAAGASGRSHDARPSFYLVAGDASTCSRLMLQSARAAIPLLDAGCPSGDTLPATNAYSLLSAEPVAAADDSTRLELWHWSLERFGAEQLNERYRRRFGARMDSAAWTGWFALKVALDAALHAHAVTGVALLRQLADPRSQYDGQKGRPLRFAPDSHRLVQPLYRVAGLGDAEHVVAEVAP